jgi:hypothetical protein
MTLRNFVLGLAFLGAAAIAARFALLGRAADGVAAGVSEKRSLSGFDRIRLTGPFTTEITAGEQTLVTFSGDRDAVSRITTKVDGDTLIVGMRGGDWPFQRKARLAIALPMLRGVANDGAGSVRISGLTGGDIEIENAGAGSIVASGRAANEAVSLDGVGKIDATAVDAHDVTVNNNGVGSVLVRASGVLSMSVNGLGEIRYAGNPSHVESQVNGLGRIGRL